MTKDLDLYDVVDAVLVDDFGPCADAGFSWCPKTPAPLQADPHVTNYDGSYQLTYIHDSCASQRSQDN